MISPEGKTIEYALKFQFRATNNEAEYEAAIALQSLGSKIRTAKDGFLVGSKSDPGGVAKEPSLQKYLAKVKGLVAIFEGFEVERLTRSQNEQADALSKLGSADQHNMKRSVLVEVKHQSVIHEDATSIFAINRLNLPPWMEKMLKYIEEGELLVDPIRAKKIKNLAPQFTIINNELYKVAKSGPLLKCVTP